MDNIEQFVDDLAKALATSREPILGDNTPDTWNAERERSSVFWNMFYSFQRMLTLAPDLSTKLQEREQEVIQLKSELLALQSMVNLVSSQYETLVQQNTKFMKACVCVKLNQEPNNPQAVFK